jgi:hypothetical protein
MSEGSRMKVDTRNRRTDMERAGGLGEEYGRMGRVQGRGGGRWGERDRGQGSARKLADTFDKIRKEMEGKMEAVVGKVQDKMQEAMREGMKVMAETVNEKNAKKKFPQKTCL